MAITFLPLDLTGKAFSNRRTDERHLLITVNGKKNRICVLDHGAFYTEGLEIRDATTRLLIPGKDFTTTYCLDHLSGLTAKEIMSLIVVTNPAVQGPVSVQYQALGGPFSLSAKELKDMMDQLDESNFTAKWEDIIGKPSAYAPEKHQHKFWQMYGMESMVTEIDRIAAAADARLKAVTSYNEDYGDIYIQKARDAITDYTNQVNAHLNNRSNPHATDKIKLKLSLMNNWGVSTPAQILDRNNNNTYLPIGGMYRILNTGPLTELTAHLRNFSNPHGTTANIIGSYTKVQIDAAFNNYYLWTDTAANASLFSGVDNGTLNGMVKEAIDPTWVISGMFPTARLGTGYDGTGSPQDWVYTGAGTWRKWADLLRQYNESRVVYVSAGQQPSVAAALAFLTATYGAAYPVGTYGFASVYQYRSDNVQYYSVVTFSKLASGWAQTPWQMVGP
jgi:hypothetical protein